MKLIDTKREYDVALSLGASCRVASQMNRHNLRRFSGPLDWFTFLPVPKLIEALATEFTEFMELPNLQVEGELNGYYLVRDTRYDCLSVHDFPSEPDPLKQLIAYPGFREKTDRRIRRFYERVRNGRSVLFIRSFCTYDEAKDLEQCIRDLAGSDFTLLIVNYTCENNFLEKDWGLSNTCSIEMYHQDDVWSGYDPHWDLVLGGIRANERLYEKLLNRLARR